MNIIISFRDKDIEMAIQITNEQLKKLESYALDNYIRELLMHCDDYYPYLREIMGEEKLCQVLKDCVVKIEQKGVTQRGPIQFYIDMMIAFGFGFETDPQYPWIQKTLERNKHLSQIERSSELYALTKDYFDQILGPQSQYFFEFSGKLQQLTIQELYAYKASFVAYMHKILEDIYPQKYATIAEESITALIVQGTKKAQTSYSFTRASSVAVIILLMFFLGHEFDNDPFYDWARFEKNNSYSGYTSAAGDQSFTANKLLNRCKIWFAGAVENEKLFLQKETDKQGGIS